MSIVHTTPKRTVHDKDLSFTFYMEVEQGGEFATEELPFVVWQVDVDDKGKAWNSTPCRSLPTEEQAIKAAYEWS